MSGQAGPGKSLGQGVLVGAGPGDPGLLTRSGAAWLERADVVVYDHLSDARLLELAPAHAERILAGKTKGACVLSQDEINRILVEKARQGLCVVRLKGGDPYIFGRGAEEAEYLRASGVPYRVVPGVTAGVGVTSYAGIPLTHRGTASAVAFVTGHHDPKISNEPGGRPRVDWSALARFPGTLVVYMGVSRLGAIVETLIREGLSSKTPAAVVHSGTLARQRTITANLDEISEAVNQAGFGSPALLVIGEVVANREPLNWFERLPLFGQRIVVTRPIDEARKSAELLESLGAEVLFAPSIEILPLIDSSKLDDAITRLNVFDWLVFTSSNGVRHFLDRLPVLGHDLRALGRIKIAAIGPTTVEALASYHLKANLVPTEFRSEALAEAMKPLVAGRNVLLARADRGRDLLLNELDGIAHVEQVPIYRNVDVASLPETVIDRIEAGTIDWITLTSSAIANRFFELLPEEAGQKVGTAIKLAAISSLTAQVIRDRGWPVAVEAKRSDWCGLTEGIVEWVANHPTIGD